MGESLLSLLPSEAPIGAGVSESFLAPQISTYLCLNEPRAKFARRASEGTRAERARTQAGVRCGR